MPDLSRPALRRLEGEQILWSGQPKLGPLFMPRDAFFVPISLLWFGFAIFWEATALRTRGDPFSILWGAPFVLSGLYLVVGRFVVDAWLRRRTTYAITDRRVLIRRSGPLAKVTAIGLDQLPDASLISGANGRGTIRFGEQRPFLEWNWAWRGSPSNMTGLSGWTPSLDPMPQFLAIADAQQVFDLVQRLAKNASRP